MRQIPCCRTFCHQILRYARQIIKARHFLLIFFIRKVTALCRPCYSLSPSPPPPLSLSTECWLPSSFQIITWYLYEGTSSVKQHQRYFRKAKKTKAALYAYYSIISSNFQRNCELSAEKRLIYCATDVIHITTNTTPET